MKERWPGPTLLGISRFSSRLAFAGEKPHTRQSYSSAGHGNPSGRFQLGNRNPFRGKEFIEIGSCGKAARIEHASAGLIVPVSRVGSDRIACLARELACLRGALQFPVIDERLEPREPDHRRVFVRLRGDGKLRQEGMGGLRLRAAVI